MKSNIVEPYGFCSGVTNALKIVEETLKSHPSGRIFIEHDIVHNEKIIKNLRKIKDFSIYRGETLKEGDVFIISAHGHDHDLSIKGEGYRVIDCFCPFLKKRFELIQEDEAEEFYYLGEFFHPESRSTISFIKKEIDKKARFFASEEELMEALKSEIPSSCSLIIQSTFNATKKELFKHFKKVYEPCLSVSKRWKKIKEDGGYNTYIIVGSKKSSNTTALYKIAKAYHQDKMVLMVLDLEELKPLIPTIKEPIAVFSGTSVQNEVVNSINDFLLSL